MISDTEGMHTFAGIINRTRRRDIGNFTVRKPETVVVPFTPAQQHLHDELLRIQAARARGHCNARGIEKATRPAILFGDKTRGAKWRTVA